MSLAFWQTNRRRNLWQHPVWGQFQEAIGRKTWTLECPGAQALVIQRAMPFGLNWLEVPRGPLFEDEASLKTILEQLKKLGQEQQSVFIRMSCYDPRLSSIPGLHIRNYDNHPQTSLTLDLSGTEEEILEQMKPKGRYNIKVAQKHNLRVAVSDDVELFYNILCVTSERDGFKLHSKDFYQTMLKSLVEQAQLLVVYYEDRPVAAGIFLTLDEWGIYYYGASDHHYRNLMAPYLLQWEAIREAKKRGCKYYDFLGIAPLNSLRHRWAGVTEFKLKFGGRVVSYPPARELVLRKWWYFFYQIYKRLRA
ncbi:MAG: peptidoglycan bridge formation glycyltransferase FemA/FemB family protein [Candidatus Peregrinibacteria bacterium]